MVIAKLYFYLEILFHEFLRLSLRVSCLEIIASVLPVYQIHWQKSSPDLKSSNQIGVRRISPRYPRVCADVQPGFSVVIYSAPKIESDIIHRSITRVERAINILAHTIPLHAEGLRCLLELSQLTSSNALWCFVRNRRNNENWHFTGKDAWES